MALLEIENLSVEFPSSSSVLHAVEGVSLSLDAGDVLGIVGESGSGKSVTMMALMGLVPFPGRVPNCHRSLFGTGRIRSGCIEIPFPGASLLRRDPEPPGF